MSLWHRRAADCQFEAITMILNVSGAMPIHDWNATDVGIYHDFHQAWTIELIHALNAGKLPEEYWTLTDFDPNAAPLSESMTATEIVVYAARANRIVIRERRGPVVAVIEVVSPGNKCSCQAIEQFVDRVAKWLSSQIHVLVVDLFPPCANNPCGIHNLIWKRVSGEMSVLPSNRPLAVASYRPGLPPTATIEPVAVGDSLPTSAIQLAPGLSLSVPLEETYQAAWDNCPRALKNYVKNSALS